MPAPVTAENDGPGTMLLATQKMQKMPFRELPRRPKMVPPAWLPAQEDTCNEFKRVSGRANGIPRTFIQEEKATNDLINTFETRDNDVFVCTYPKSGTTWTQHIINLLLSKGEEGDKTYMEAVPWLEYLTFTGVKGFSLPSNVDQAQGWTLETLRSTPNRRFMKTHANLKDLPCGTAKGLKVIYVARNPKDACVSLFHHLRNKMEDTFDGDFQGLLKHFVQGRCQNGSWFNHVLEWWEASNADPDHVLFLFYENMLLEPEKHIRMIAEFTGIKCTPEIIAKTAARSTLSAMKANPKANTKPSSNHLRKGGAGGWRDVFTVRESQAFDNIYLQQMRGTGLAMDFGGGLVM